MFIHLKAMLAGIRKVALYTCISSASEHINRKLYAGRCTVIHIFSKDVSWDAFKSILTANLSSE